MLDKSNISHNISATIGYKTKKQTEYWVDVKLITPQYRKN